MKLYNHCLFLYAYPASCLDTPCPAASQSPSSCPNKAISQRRRTSTEKLQISIWGQAIRLTLINCECYWSRRIIRAWSYYSKGPKEYSSKPCAESRSTHKTCSTLVEINLYERGLGSHHRGPQRAGKLQYKSFKKIFKKILPCWWQQRRRRKTKSSEVEETCLKSNSVEWRKRIKILE